MEMQIDIDQLIVERAEAMVEVARLRGKLRHYQEMLQLSVSALGSGRADIAEMRIAAVIRAITATLEK